MQGLEELGGPCLHGAAVCEDASGAKLTAQEDVLVDRSVQDRVELLVDHGDTVSDGLPGGGDGDRFAGDLDRPPVCGVDAHEDLHEGGLPGTVLAHEGVDFAGVQVEGDIVQDPYTGKRLVDTGHLKPGSAHDQAFCGYGAATRLSLTRRKWWVGWFEDIDKVQRNLMDGRVNGPDKVSECSRTEALLLGAVEPTPALRIVKIKENYQATALQFLTPTTVKNVCINAIAFYGCVSYYCPWSASILSASRPPSLLLTRGSRERALFVPYSSHIFPLVCFISVFLDVEAAGAAEDLGSRAPRPGSWRRARRL